MSPRLDEARDRLRAGIPAPPEAGAEARALRRLRAETRARPWYEPSWAQVGPALAAVAAAWALQLTLGSELGPTPGEMASPEGTLITAADPVQPWPGRRIVVAPGARFLLPAVPEADAWLRLDYGSLEAELQPGERLLIRTPQASIAGLSAHFRVEAAAEQTRVGVDQGEVQVTPKGGHAQVVGKGRRVRIDAQPVPPALPPSEPALAPQASREALPPPGQPRSLLEPPAAPASDATQRSTLEAAKHALPSDAPRAVALVESVLEQKPGPALEAEALALLADAERRRGGLEKAAELYLRVGLHPAGRPYAEEAVYQLATIELGLGRAGAAQRHLETAQRDFPRGPLAPERAALLARAHLSQGAPQAAAQVLEAVPLAVRSVLLLSARVAVARALVDGEPERARSLLLPVLSEDGAPAEWVRAAREVLERLPPPAAPSR